MARIRTVKPSFWTDVKMSRRTILARLTFIGLLNYADDEGRFQADPRLVKSAIFPLDDAVSAENVQCILTELSMNGHIILYTITGEVYGFIPKFKTHQKINRPSKSFLPPFTESSVIIHECMEEPSRGEKEGKGKGNGREKDISSAPADGQLLKKERTEAQKNTVYAMWSDEYRKMNHVDYDFSVEDKGIVAGLEKRYGHEQRNELRLIMKAYLADVSDLYVNGHGHPISLLPKRINKYKKQVVYARAKESETEQPDESEFTEPVQPQENKRAALFKPDGSPNS